MKPVRLIVGVTTLAVVVTSFLVLGAFSVTLREIEGPIADHCIKYCGDCSREVLDHIMPWAEYKLRHALER